MSATIYESGEYLAHNPDWHEADAPMKARWIMDILKRNDVQPARVVEVGCGSGEILIQLSRLLPATRFEGYDISPQAFAIAAPKATGAVSFHHADYLSAERERSDVVMAIDVFEHVDDYMTFLRGLKPTAEWKIFHIPLDLSVQGLLRSKGLMHARATLGHIHYFYKETALAVLQDCGYEIVDWNYTHGAESLPDKSLRTRLFNLPRRLMRLISEDFGVRVMGGASMMVLAR